MSMPSMTLLFPECARVLRDERQPFHYKTLTDRALDRMGVHLPKECLRRVQEDVREKLLEKRRHGLFYTGTPDCLGALSAWFLTQQEEWQMDAITIPGDATSGIHGAYEGMNRQRYMLHKNIAVPIETVNHSRAQGLVIEAHVRDWFVKHYPDFYSPPLNDGKWEQPCDHDFQLVIRGKPYMVDVFGPDCRGNYKNPGKHSVDFHLAARIADNGRDVLWESVYPGDQFNGTLEAFTGKSPVRMTVWLNCIKDNLDYRRLRQCAQLALSK